MAVCSNGACTGDCTPGAKRCMGTAVQTCSAAAAGSRRKPARSSARATASAAVSVFPAVASAWDDASGVQPDGMWMNSTGNECLKALGASCGNGRECMSDNCVDGVCCTSSSCPTCQRCGSSGRCADTASDSRCDAGRMCRSGSCELVCKTTEYREGDICLPKKGLEADCSKNDECQTNYCINGPATDGQRCCRTSDVTCDGFCVPYDGDEWCISIRDPDRSGALDWCDTFGYPCDPNYIQGMCRTYGETGTMRVNVYRYTKANFTQKRSPSPVDFCCVTGQRGACP